jgi:hypothetical protein
MAPDAWRLVFPKEDSSFTIEFRDLTDGIVLLKEQGHEEPGSIFLIDSAGRFLVRRDLLQGFFFTEEFGERSDGAVVLCNRGARGDAWCDTWSDLPAGKLTGATQFPEDCTWPRFLPDGSGVCWLNIERKLAIESGPLDGRFKSYQIPLQPPFKLQELHPLARSLVILVIDGAIYAWNGQSVTTMDTPPVLDSRQVGNRLYFTTCNEPLPNPGRCHVWWTDSGLALHDIRSSDYTPHRFQVLSDGSLIVDEWREGIRRIVKVGPAPDHETILWSETGDIWR